MVPNEKRPRGRPRRYAPGKRPTVSFRLPETLLQDLTAAADTSGRSTSEEIEKRLTEWVALQQTRDEVEQLRAAGKAQLDANRIQAIRQAGFQIVREAGGNVTVNVSPELLLAEAEGILRSGFVAAEDVDKTPTEIMIERAVERALERAGLLGRKKGVA